MSRRDPSGTPDDPSGTPDAFCFSWLMLAIISVYGMAPEGHLSSKAIREGYYHATFLGTCLILEYGKQITTQAAIPELDQAAIVKNQVTLKVIDSYKGEPPGAILEAMIDPRCYNMPAIGSTNHLSIATKGHEIIRFYTPEEWVAFQAVVQLIHQGKFKLVDPPDSLKDEFKQRNEQYGWAQIDFREGRIGKEEYDKRIQEYEQWITDHPEIKEYFMPDEP